MALSTAGDLIAFALRAAGVNGIGQSPSATDSNDGLAILNMLLAEWQLNRWLVYDLVEAVAMSTGALSYTVGAAGTFVLAFSGQRPDRIDSVYARLIGTPNVDTYLYPFASREGFNRAAVEPGAPEAYFYDASAGATGTLYIYPIPPSTYELHVQAKASLGQFAALTTPLTLPLQYTTALVWNLAKDMRPVFGLPDDPSVSARAQQALLAIGGSGAQLAQAQQVSPSRRSGVFSHVVPAPQQSGG